MKDRTVFLVSFLLIALLVVCLYFYGPRQGGIYPPCLFHKITGLYCPGCGATRALHELLHLHISASLDYNLLFVILIPFLIGWYLSYGLSTLGIRMNHGILFHPSLLKALLLFSCLFAIARNIPVEPFYRLAP
jgi:hypothetical protein